ncbi:hypothetical protein C0989_000570 [Termitomyces sp. Mn162]|nr:hypothetical protein C0989_000570 [Termitomyces sp. Mn162]
MPTPTTHLPSIPTPPSFADFKFSVIGQPPQLLKRISATSPDFRHSPTPIHMELQYPSRTGTPWTPGQSSQPSLQQRLSTDHSTGSDFEGLYIPMDLSDHLPDQKHIIESEALITSPLQSFQVFDEESVPTSTTRHASLHRSLDLRESHPIPAVSSSNTHATIALPTSPSLPIQTALVSGPLSVGASEAHHRSKSHLYESALITLEKAKCTLKLAQETYDAAKAAFTAISMTQGHSPQTLVADAHQQHTNKIGIPRSFPSNDQEMTNAFEPLVTVVSGHESLAQTVPFQKQPLQRTDYLAHHCPTTAPTKESRVQSHRMTELEREADDVRLAWSSLSAQKLPIIPASIPEADDDPLSVTSPGTSAGSSPVPPSTKAGFVADPAIIAKDEDITDADDNRQHHVQTPLHNSSSKIARGTDSARTSSHIPIDHDVDRTTLAPVSASSRLVKDSEVTRAATLDTPTDIQGTIINDDLNGRHTKATGSASSDSLANTIDLEDTAEDEDLDDSDHTRSESNPISLGEDVSNELEVERELEREDPVPYSPSTSASATPNDTVDGGIPRGKLSPISKGGQDVESSSTTIQGPISELIRSSTLLDSSSQDDHSSTNANTLFQRLQWTPTVSSPEISEPQLKSVTEPSSSPPSVLGKRRHLDPSSPRQPQAVASPFKRRHFTGIEPNDHPSLQSRISEASARISEVDQSSSSISLTPRQGGHNYKNGYVSRKKYIAPAEGSMSPPSGPRASRQESVYSNHSSGASSRLPSDNYWSHVDRQLGVGSDSYPSRLDRFKSKGLQNKYIQDGPFPTSGLDRPLGAGREGKRLGHHRVTHSQNRGRGSTTYNTGPLRSDMRAPPLPSERRGHEQMSLADRLRDP